MASVEEVIWSDIWALVREVFGPGVGLAALALMWRAATGFNTMRKDHTELEREHQETRRRVVAIEDKVEAANVQIAKLATRDDLDRMGERVHTQIQTAFGQILNLLKGSSASP